MSDCIKDEKNAAPLREYEDDGADDADGNAEYSAVMQLTIESTQTELVGAELFDEVLDEMARESGFTFVDDSDDGSGDNFDDDDELGVDDDEAERIGGTPFGQPENLTVTTEALYEERDGRVSLSYSEDALTGFENSRIMVSFDKSAPGIITVMRGGMSNTVFVIEEGKRYLCVYETPIMPFEMCVRTYGAQNGMTREGGVITLDYAVELKGCTAQRTTMRIEARRV